MNYDCWIQAGRPHWQCRVCMRIMVTIPIDDDFTCPGCKYRTEYGTERCPHICHYIHDVLQKSSIYTHPQHCSACDGSRIITMAEAKERGLPQRASEDDFTEWFYGRKDLLGYCVCPRYIRSCRFHNGGKTVTDGPHNVMPALPSTVKCRCGCSMEISALGTTLGSDSFKHFNQYNRGVSYAVSKWMNDGSFQLFYSPEITNIKVRPMKDWTSSSPLSSRSISWGKKYPCGVRFWTDNDGKPHMEVINESGGNPSKVCGLTADEIRKQYEDAMMGLLGNLPDWKLAVIYAWLHSRGMRMDDTERVIREGLRKEVASK